MGNDEVVTAIADQFWGSESHFGLYATGVLEDIRSDLAAATCVSFLLQEKDRFIQRRLTEAAFTQFEDGAIEPVRQLILSQRLDGELRNLRDYLVETCQMMGERFPEYDQWKIAGEREREEHRRQLEEVGDDPRRMLLFALQKANEYFSEAEGEAAKHQQTTASPGRRRLGGRFRYAREESRQKRPMPVRQRQEVQEVLLVTRLGVVMAKKNQRTVRKKTTATRFTAKQGQYLAFIHLFRKLRWHSPSEAEIAEHFGVSGPSVHQMIVTLEKNQLITREAGAARFVRVAIPPSEIPELEEQQEESQLGKMEVLGRARVYALQVFLIGGLVSEKFAGKEISRTIEICGHQTLEDLHRAIRLRPPTTGRVCEGAHRGGYDPAAAA